MTDKEANEVLKRWKGCKENRFDDFCKQKRTCIGCEYEFEDEEVKEAIDMAHEALEKQIPMKTILIHETDYDVRHYLCPVCDEWVSEGANYCYGCGQAIDWSK